MEEVVALMAQGDFEVFAHLAVEGKISVPTKARREVVVTGTGGLISGIQKNTGHAESGSNHHSKRRHLADSLCLRLEPHAGMRFLSCDVRQNRERGASSSEGLLWGKTCRQRGKEIGK
jgi:hypothetical protein